MFFVSLQVICPWSCLQQFCSQHQGGVWCRGSLPPKLDVSLYRWNVDFQKFEHTRIISNSISWSTCINFWSHSSISVDFFRESLSSSATGVGSDLWCSHHSITLRRTASLTWNYNVSLTLSFAESTMCVLNLKSHIWNWNGLILDFTNILQHVLD